MRLRWSSIKDDSVQVIHPDTAADAARRTLFYTEVIRPYVNHGYTHPALKVPIVLHPENMRTNGIVMFMPKRIEMLTAPAIDGFSMPWQKQLVAHEYRHAVQYNNINRGVIRVLSYIAGQQAPTVGLLFIPLWAIEGDAVMNETQMSTFGRGVQPKNTLKYRAEGNIARQGRNMEKWFCGSFCDEVPDHYLLGYQITSYAYTKYDENIWNKVIRYGVRNPYVFATTAVPLKKFYGTSVKKLAVETFDDLAAWWDSLPQTDDSSMRVPQAREPRLFTTYEHPISLNDTTILSLKTGLDVPARFVLTDTRTGDERLLAYTGTVSTRPVADTVTRTVWWSEFRRSLLYDERVNSVLCRMSLDNPRPRTVRTRGNVLYPTVTDEGLAWVDYDPSVRYSVVRADSELNEIARVTLPLFAEIHGLAYDNATRRLYFIVTDDDGMHIASTDDDGNVVKITEPAYITLSNLRAADGVLYFGSIASGKDEVHCFDLASGCEQRISTSKYGSFSPAPARGATLMTTFDRMGYHLAVQPDTLPRETVAKRSVPIDLLNPPRVKWDVINLDTVRFSAADSAASVEMHRSRRYPKFTHLFKIHSWAPVSYDPFEIIDEKQANFNLGATVLSQNLLSNSQMFLTYGWNRAEGSVVKGTWRYYGLGVNLSLNAAYGGHQRVYGVAMYDHEAEKFVVPAAGSTGRYWSVSASAALPLVFQRGYHTRALSLSASYGYSNGLVARTSAIDDTVTSDIDRFKAIGYDCGLHTLQFGVTYSDNVRLAYRDFLPRTGMLFSLGGALNPQNRAFSSMVSAYARFYLPGFAPHNSISLAAAYQTSLGGFSNPKVRSTLSYTSTRLLPRGYTTADINNRNYAAASFNYALPVCYPDGGIPSVIYFKRIRLNLGFDYATFEVPVYYLNRRVMGTERRHIFSYGGDVSFDINLFRMPAAATSSVTVSVYVPRGSRKPFVSAGVGLPF